MTLIELDRIKESFYKEGKITDRDIEMILNEATKFHHKVSKLQEMLILIKKQCQLEMHDLESGKPATRMHFEMLLEYIVKVILDSQHIKAA